MTSKNVELCIVDVKGASIYDFSNNMNDAERVLQSALKRKSEDIKTWGNHCKNYPDVEKFKKYLTQAQNKEYEIMTYDEFLQLQKSHYLKEPLTEVTEEVFHDMLDVLPPLKWCTKGSIEMFCMCEMLTGTYSSQYLHDRSNDKFYHKIVDVTDQSTWGYNFL